MANRAYTKLDECTDAVCAIDQCDYGVCKAESDGGGYEPDYAPLAQIMSASWSIYSAFILANKQKAPTGTALTHVVEEGATCLPLRLVVSLSYQHHVAWRE